MKKILVSFTALALPLFFFAQADALAFERVIKEGNSEKGFAFVRNMFGVPAAKDPFLHFEEEGISKLSSYCSYRLRKVVATSLIKFGQVKEFWTNYSREFTAGKWNYRSLYKTDSLAWIAANYSIILIYAHEMGHYMSYRYRAAPNTIYTCEEVLANECLAAFANAFTGHKMLNEQKKLFIKLAQVTTQLIPDSNKTDFYTPADQWCTKDPMQEFLPFFQSDSTKFLRLYGYSQFKMMEELLVHYKGGGWNSFLAHKFYSQYEQKTLQKDFKPKRYKTILSENIPGINHTGLLHEMSTAGNISYYDYYFDSYNRYTLNNDGRIFNSAVEKENAGAIMDTTGEEVYTNYNYLIKNQVLEKDSVYQSSFRYIDSNHNTVPRLLSVWENSGLMHYLIWQRTTPDSSMLNFTYTGQTDTLFYHRMKKEGNDIYYSSYALPASVTKDSNAVTSQVLLAGTNLGIPVIIINKLSKEEQQETRIYLVDTSTDRLGELLWSGLNQNKGYLFMQSPFVYFDNLRRKIWLAFSNSFTEKIYLLGIAEGGTSGYELCQTAMNKTIGPQMQVMALQMTAPNKMYVLAWCRKPGNKSSAETKKMLIQW